MFLIIICTLLVIKVALWIRWRRNQLSVFKRLGIPGPEPNIFNGNMYELYRKDFDMDYCNQVSYQLYQMFRHVPKHQLKYEGPLDCWKEWAEKYGRVYGYYLGFTPILYVSDPELLKKIQIKDFHSFMDRPSFFGGRKAIKGSVESALTSAPSTRWKELRSILTPSFTTARMKMMMPLMNNAVNLFVSKIEKAANSGKEFDIHDCYQKLTLDVIGRAAFGLTSDVQNDEDSAVLRLGKIIFGGKFQSVFLLLAASLPEFPNFVVYLKQILFKFANDGRNPGEELNKFVSEVIKQRRENPELRRPDLLQLMLDAELTAEDLKKDDTSLLTAGEDEHVTSQEKPGKQKGNENLSKYKKHLTDEEVKTNAMVFFLAGYETTSNLLSYSTYLMAKHPEEQEKVRKEVLELLEQEGELEYGSISKLKYLDQVMSESLRVYPPVLFVVNREALTDVTYGRLHIPKGMAVQVPVYNLHHDPEFWDEPEKFEPARFSPENRSNIIQMAYQPFGAGPRNCIGMRFAQMEAKIALAHIIRNFRLELSPRYNEKPLPLRAGFAMMTPEGGLYVKATRTD